MSLQPLFRVDLHGRTVGHIYAQGDTVAFQFDSGYTADPDRSVLGLRFEENLGRVHYANRQLPSWFGHLLPEGQLRELLDASLGLKGIGSRLSHEIALLKKVGHDLPGAVQLFEPDPELAGDIPGGPATVEDSTEGLLGTEDSDALRFSVAGVGLKMSLLRTNHRFTAPGKNRRGEWLIKLPDRTFPHLPVNEYATMGLASQCGIDVPEIELVRRDEIEPTPDGLWSGEDQAYAIRRFDRDGFGGAVHIEDMAQVRNVEVGFGKYSGNFETVGNLAYRGHDVRSLEQFVRRLAFSFLVGNSDAHLKNWSLIYRDGRLPALAPAYDIVAVVGYSDLGIDTSLGLRFSNRRRYDQVGLDGFERMRRLLNATIDLREIAAETTRLAVANLGLFEDRLRSAPDVRTRVLEHVAVMRARLS